LFINLPSPHPGAPACPFTLKVLRAKERAPIPSPSVVFTFGLAMSPSKSLGMRQQLWKYVKEFVESCDVFVRANNFHHYPHGLFQSLSIPTSPWSSISMDFITNLPPSSFYGSILVVVNRLTKIIHFIMYQNNN
jgi:hypothetical protein